MTLAPAVIAVIAWANQPKTEKMIRPYLPRIFTARKAEYLIIGKYHVPHGGHENAATPGVVKTSSCILYAYAGIV